MIYKILDRLMPKKLTLNLKKGFNQNYYKLHIYNSASDYISTQIKKHQKNLTVDGRELGQLRKLF